MPYITVTGHRRGRWGELPVRADATHVLPVASSGCPQPQAVTVPSGTRRVSPTPDSGRENLVGLRTADADTRLTIGAGDVVR